MKHTDQKLVHNQESTVLFYWHNFRVATFNFFWPNGLSPAKLKTLSEPRVFTSSALFIFFLSYSLLKGIVYVLKQRLWIIPNAVGKEAEKDRQDMSESCCVLELCAHTSRTGQGNHPDVLPAKTVTETLFPDLKMNFKKINTGGGRLKSNIKIFVNNLTTKWWFTCTYQLKLWYI